MPSVAFGVVAHQARRAAALALADPLGAYVSLDDGVLGAEANHLRVWEVLADASAEWVCVLEDDAVPSPNFLAQITAALTVAPSPVVSLYLGRARPPGVQSRIQGAIRRLDAEGACWITADRMLHAVGICVRANLTDDMLVHLRRAPDRFPADERYNTWLRVRRHRVAYAVPSLVEHADGPTLIDHPDRQARTEPRHAWRAGWRPVWSSRSVRL
ncbi:hypothetical protein IU421_13270 [Nocardia cyriacigeorgica]|uniref:hypothetical protein n=1 Tax=Nocardia cyriacigeorgica TaxID=135487 RepID=UPI001892D76B|nr:hypothetical protein [Nocardia cyriacigeorgica]MBF6515251.1 hypothetical protein [Nocardia cyriacigeorgica]